MNGMNGNGVQPQININPVEAARVGLMFLQRVQFNASERQAFDAVEALLNAIAQQRLLLSQPETTAPPTIPDKPESRNA